MLVDRNVAPGPLLPQSDRTLAAREPWAWSFNPFTVRVAGARREPGRSSGASRGALIMESPLLYLHTRLYGMTSEKSPARDRFVQGVRRCGWSDDLRGGALAEMHRRAAVYADKILRGAKPADLPIEQPTRFDFVINLKAARAMGLTIPPYVLGQATEVIQ